MKPLAHRLLETLLARLVELDDHAAEALRGLGERLVAVEVRPDGPNLLVRLSQGRIEVTHARAARPDARLAGRPAALARALLPAPRSGAGAPLPWEAPGSGLVAEGDLELLGRLVGIGRGLDPDWEERLARVTGDVPARLIGNAARDVGRWGRGALAALGLDAAEYLQHEARLVPSRPEWEGFVAEVARLDAASRRLAGRVEVLAGRRRPRDPGPR